MIDFNEFKKREFAVKCLSNEAKEKFFSECKNNDIHIFMGEHERKLNIFFCHKAYGSISCKGRYELLGIPEQETKGNGFFKNIKIKEIKK